MRTIGFILVFNFLLVSGSSIAWAGGHDVVSGHAHVSGVCDMCKNRIENAAYIRGVKKAEWNADTQDLQVRYDSTKTNLGAILKCVAAAGHDNELYKATDDDYGKIPKCCRYRTVKKH